MTEQYIKTEGCYVGLFDVGSPANVAGLFEAYLAEANREAESAGEVWAGLLYFNQHWIDAAKRGEILSWIVMFDGVFKVTADVVSSSPSIEVPGKSFVGQKSHPLICPSGYIMVASLHATGNPTLEPIVLIEPGSCHVDLTLNAEQESEHAFLENVAQYPRNDGPDWSIMLWSAYR